VKLPVRLRRALDVRSPNFERQRVILALLLQPPAALCGRRDHRWQPPPFAKGSPAGGHFAAVREMRDE